ncbi:MAG: hypothetical protein CMJ94_06845 [Planctomycetes bacterium]|nr:hypothetical protein [Planctomycetota bacterium]
MFRAGCAESLGGELMTSFAAPRQDSAYASIYVNVLVDPGMDWWASLLAMRRLESDYRDEMVRIDSRTGRLEARWVAPPEESFHFERSTAGTELPFHTGVGGMHGECLECDGGSAEPPLEMRFERGGVAYVARESPVRSRDASRRGQFRRLSIEHEGSIVYSVDVDLHDEAYLWNRSLLEAGFVLHIPHGVPRFRFFRHVTLIRWEDETRRRFELPTLPGSEAESLSVWSRVDQEGQVRIGGYRQVVDLEHIAYEHVLGDAPRVETVAEFPAVDLRSLGWGGYGYDWVECADRVHFVRVYFDRTQAGRLVFEVTGPHRAVRQTVIDDLVQVNSGDDPGLFDVTAHATDDLDGDGVEDILMLVDLARNRYDLAWWYVSGATGEVLRK